jgi:Raf kinase inhibitor-like YbhB/YbcL family protein
MTRTAAACLVAALALAGCGGDDSDDGGDSGMQLESAAFEDGGQMPSRFTCDGEGRSPPLEWSGVPEEAKDLAVIVEDADVPVSAFVHWTVWHLPFADGGSGRVLEDDVAPEMVEGLTDLGQNGWFPPCPPAEDGDHRFVFTLHALDRVIDLPRKTTTPSLVRAAIVASSIAEAKLEVTYGPDE